MHVDSRIFRTWVLGLDHDREMGGQSQTDQSSAALDKEFQSGSLREMVDFIV